jgi:predicted nucleic acid-binding Zn ribbon protein
MSEKRSWDIQPKRVAAPAQPSRPIAQKPEPRQVRSAPTPAPRPRPIAKRGIFGKKKEREKRIPHTGFRPISEPVNRTNVPTSHAAPLPAPAIRVVRPAPKTAQIPKGKDREPLKARRRRARKRSLTIFLILLLLVIFGSFASLWIPAFRIRSIQAGGPDSDGMQTISTNVLQGTYHYIVPRNSIFFFPENDIRSQILAAYPDISAVSISRVSFDAIAVISIPREAALTWCGPTYVPGQQPVVPVLTNASSTAPLVTPDQPTCYSADADGIIFAPISEEAASSSDALKIYDSIAGNPDSTASPLGATIGEATMIPNALQFVKSIRSLGVPIVSLVIRGDEADLYAQSGTRITYVLGQEEVSAQLAASAFPSLDLSDGSLEYVDLRFAGKVYFKKYGDTGTTQATSTSGH